MPLPNKLPRRKIYVKIKRNNREGSALLQNISDYSAVTKSGITIASTIITIIMEDMIFLVLRLNIRRPFLHNILPVV